jgi:hypothetical protein
VHTEDGRKILIRPYLSQFKQKPENLEEEPKEAAQEAAENKENIVRQEQEEQVVEAAPVQVTLQKLPVGPERPTFKKIKLTAGKVIKGLSLEAESEKYVEPKIRFNFVTERPQSESQSQSQPVSSSSSLPTITEKSENSATSKSKMRSLVTRLKV